MILQDRTLAFILHCFLFLFSLDIQIETKSKICLIGTSFYHNIGMEGEVMGSRPTKCVCVCLCNLPIKKKKGYLDKKWSFVSITLILPTLTDPFIPFNIFQLHT